MRCGTPGSFYQEGYGNGLFIQVKFKVVSKSGVYSTSLWSEVNEKTGGYLWLFFLLKNKEEM